MKTYVHLWQCLAEFFFKWELFQAEVVDEIKADILYSIICFWKSHHFWDNVKRCGRTRQATDNNTAQKKCNLHAR
jgi:hypothetical protein